MAYDLYDDFYDAFFNDGRHSRSNLLKTDVIEDPDCYILFIDMPGAKKENIHLDFNDNYLKVSYKESENEHSNKKYLRKERFYGSYSRSYLFNDVDANNIEASYSDGVLKVVLHKKTENSIKAIEIK